MSSQLSQRTDRRHDVVVIGGGSAGYAAARTARDAGADVAIVDQGPLGGLCILRGCMPTKTILRSAEIMALMKRAREFGLAPVNAQADLAAIVDRKNRLVQEFADYRIAALRDPGFTLYESRAEFISPHEIRVGTLHIRGNAFVIATGSRPAEIAIPGLDQAGYLTSDDMLDVRRAPSSLLVLGGGLVAVEFAQFFARIGTKVTMLQRGATLLSDMDQDVGQALEAAFQAEGIEVITGVSFQQVTSTPTEKTVHFRQGSAVHSRSAELIFQALGRRPNLNGLNVEAAGVDVIDGRLVVGPDMRTSQPHIFAVGDVNDLTPIVHLAIQQGETAAWNATHAEGPARVIDHRLDSEMVFTDPQVAVAGLSERQCRARSIPYLTASYPFADHGKAMCLGASHGFVKLLCRPDTGELLGAQIVGPEAAELIHELIAVMYFHGTAQDLLRIPHYHPTLAEIVTYPAESILEQMGQA
ncbi:MAG: FAD-dependent oxidoreductase [Nitrospira sp.]|uniref:Dihydrolipoyl dehydrogenase n=2 Tax=Nitrospira defluvii TaxID=330214 RepID=A0ABM8QS91_9BACT|nr:FAD-dependent oxidoreductase [Nitrospira sp.]CAE6712629.1 Dihydrolipoyl dehydrogenase [Nitrospira defluvii]